VVLEPRGHADMLAAQLTDPLSPGAHAGIVFMGALGYPAMSGHGIIAAATIGLERGLFFSGDTGADDVTVVFETVAGLVPARVHVHRRGEGLRADSVSFTNVPAFVHAPGHVVTMRGRDLRVDIAYGGQFCAIVDTEAVGIPLQASRAPDLRRLAVDVAAAVNASVTLVHPVMPFVSGLAAVVFTGPPQDPEAHLRTMTVSSGGAVNRSPSGTGMSAVMSVLDAMGLLPEVGPFVQEGLVGSIFRGRLLARTLVGEAPAVSVEIEGTAWITGDHTFVLDEDDPFRDGVRI
jgi:proline racemase